MAESKIEWTEQTWNPATGCTKVSPGCKHCYAETMAGRLKAMGASGYLIARNPELTFSCSLDLAAGMQCRSSGAWFSADAHGGMRSASLVLLRIIEADVRWFVGTDC
jgi:hypothetical protein